MTIKVGIIDYGMGNLRSVSNAVLGYSSANRNWCLFEEMI